jgi:hypothetical protein
VHGWVHNAKPLGMSFSTLKYRDIDVPERAAKRTAWNQLVLWPAWALLAVALVVLAPRGGDLGARALTRARGPQ